MLVYNKLLLFYSEPRGISIRFTHHMPNILGYLTIFKQRTLFASLLACLEIMNQATRFCKTLNIIADEIAENKKAKAKHQPKLNV